MSAILNARPLSTADVAAIETQLGKLRTLLNSTQQAVRTGPAQIDVARMRDQLEDLYETLEDLRDQA
jgi:uncharacterized coiled-coil protein SlyX